jgi:hypothetical protein
MKIMTRAQAREAGYSVFFSGDECPQGHIAERYTRSGTCIECSKAAGARYMKKYRKTEKYLAYQREYQREYQKQRRARLKKEKQQ